MSKVQIRTPAPPRLDLTWPAVRDRARALTHEVRVRVRMEGLVRVHAVPRGGLYVGAMLAAMDPLIVLVENPDDADIFVDDIIDSGATKLRYQSLHPLLMPPPFVALVDKQQEKGLPWVTFPWERAAAEANEAAGPTDNIRRLLQSVGEDPLRGGLLETPERVVKAWSYWCKGYQESPADILKVFEDGAENVDEMVVVRDIEVWSHCEHHMAPFFGRAHIGYIPNGKIVGLSKLARLTDCFARRLQVQERMTTQIADALVEHLQPQGVGVVVECRHLCMESRGVRTHGSATLTSALRGAMKDEPSAREEFLALVRSRSTTI